MKILFVFIGILSSITYVYGNLFISEILPNTIDDKNLEYIRLYNSGSTDINILNYKITDKANKEYIFLYDLIIKSNIGKKFYRKETGITLNNSKEKLYLYNNTGKLIDVFSYKTSIKGKYILKSDLDSNNIDKIPFSSIKRRIDEIRYNNSKNKNYYNDLEKEKLILSKNDVKIKNIAFRGANNTSNIKNIKINNNNNNNNNNNSGDVITLTNNDKIIFTSLLVIIGFMMLFIILRKEKVL